MVSICPTVTVQNIEDFKAQLEKAAPLSPRLHIDLSDGSLAPRNLLPVTAMNWPPNLQIDLHAMVMQPDKILNELIRSKPKLVIVHAEAEGNMYELAKRFKINRIKVGVALLQPTPAAVVMPALDLIDHVLIFSGNLGYQGGSSVDFSLIDKISQLKYAKPSLEIGWDGGVNDTNIADLIRSGVDVINVGGYIQNSQDPVQAYAKLNAAAGII